MVAFDGLIFALVTGAIAASGFGARWVATFVSAALVAATVRIVLTVRDGRLLMADLRREAHVDATTGLGNRLALLEHLEQEHASATAPPSMLAVFSLHGLQHYSETYGGLAGDALVRRLARRLAGTTAGVGHSFRPADGRFAIVQRVGRAGFGPLLTAATAALSEDGDEFCIDAVAGVVLLPDEASTAPHALALAEQRLLIRNQSYALGTAPSLRRLVTGAIDRRREGMTTGAPTLAGLARAVAWRLGLDPEQTARAALASELYDIGNLVIPREVLAAAGPGEGMEWEFIEHHSIIGERIVQIAVDAPDVAGVIRTSHEYFDGTGYPDGLAGAEIPIEARIATVCAAFEAMLTLRPHQPARSSVEAVEELAAGAGTRFDPDVVRAFSFALAEASSRRGLRDGRLPDPSLVERS